MSPSLAYVAIALFVVGTLTGVSTTPPPAHWGDTLGTTSVPLGVPFLINVYGPAGGSFNVSLNYAPYNSTTPFVVEAFTLPNTTNPTTGDAYQNVSLNTTRWDLGTLQVTVSVVQPAFIISYTIVYVTPSVNLTQLQNQVLTLEQNQIILNDRELSLLYRVEQLSQEVQDLFWIGFGETVFFSLIVLFTRPAIQNLRLVKKWVIDPLYHLLRRVPWIEYDAGWVTDPAIPPANPLRIYWGIAYPRCRRCAITQTRDDIMEHYVKDHGILHPIEGVHFAPHMPTVRDRTRTRPGTAPRRSTFRKELDSVQVDLSDLGGN